jgi:hypothetical protein
MKLEGCKFPWARLLLSFYGFKVSPNYHHESVLIPVRVLFAIPPIQALRVKWARKIGLLIQLGPALEAKEGTQEEVKSDTFSIGRK